MKAIFLALLLSSNLAFAETPKYLYYKYNDNVVITISNVLCPINEFKDEFKFAAVASRIDGSKLIGCFKKKDEDTLTIQWYHGDQSNIPANYFLQKLEVLDRPSTL